MRATLKAACVLTALAFLFATGSGRVEYPAAGQKTAAVKCGLGNGAKATGKPIKIGALVTASGGIDFSSSPKAAAAYFNCVNANGGINGRPIQYKWYDDALNPQKASQLATKLASDTSIVANAGDATFVSCGVAQPIFQKAGLYAIMGVGVPRSCFESRNLAPTNAGPRVSGLGAIWYLIKVKGAKSVSALIPKIPGVGDWIGAGMAEYAKSQGVKFNLVLSDPPLKDPNSDLLQALRSKPDAIIPGWPGPDDVGILNASQKQGLRSRGINFAGLTSSYDEAIPGQIGSYWEGYPANSEFTALDAKTPDNVLWRQAMDTYGKKGDPRDSFSQAGFLAAKILVDTLLKLPSADLDSRAKVAKAIVGIKGWRSDMFCTPWYFGSQKIHNANHDTRFVAIKDGKWKLIKGCSPDPDPALKPLYALEKAKGLTR